MNDQTTNPNKSSLLPSILSSSQDALNLPSTDAWNVFKILNNHVWFTPKAPLGHPISESTQTSVCACSCPLRNRWFSWSLSARRLSALPDSHQCQKNGQYLPPSTDGVPAAPCCPMFLCLDLQCTSGFQCALTHLNWMRSVVRVGKSWARDISFGGLQRAFVSYVSCTYANMISFWEYSNAVWGFGGPDCRHNMCAHYNVHPSISDSPKGSQWLWNIVAYHTLRPCWRASKVPDQQCNTNDSKVN